MLSRPHESPHRFLQTTAAAPFFIRNLISAPPSGKLRLAAFGASNMAYFTLDGRSPAIPMSRWPASRRSIPRRLDQLKQKYPDARVYQDWREMLKKEQHNLDIACVGTPDHMHAPIGDVGDAAGAPRLRAEAAGARPLRNPQADRRRRGRRSW